MYQHESLSLSVLENFLLGGDAQELPYPSVLFVLEGNQSRRLLSLGSPITCASRCLRSVLRDILLAGTGQHSLALVRGTPTTHPRHTPRHTPQQTPPQSGGTPAAHPRHAPPQTPPQSGGTPAAHPRHTPRHAPQHTNRAACALLVAKVTRC